jgi:hypothetical protein
VGSFQALHKSFADLESRAAFEYFASVFLATVRKIDAAMVRIPGASHGIAARPSHLLAKVAYILKWFKTHP